MGFGRNIKKLEKELERRNNISKSHKGKKHPYYKRDYKPTKEHKEKIKNSVKSFLSVPENMERHLKQFRNICNMRNESSFIKQGKTLSRNIILGISKTRKGQKSSEEHKRKIGESNNISHNRLENIKRSKEIRAKQIFPIKDTSIEIKIQNFLSLLHIEFFTHKYISEISHAYQCDILIPVQEGINQKTIIECDGCYWHGCPICFKNLNECQIKQIGKDEIRTKELQEVGFKVIRLREHDIKNMELDNFKEFIYKFEVQK